MNTVNFPQHIKDAFAARGVDAGGLIAAARGDGNAALEPCDCWVTFDAQNLYLLSGLESVKRVKGAKRLTAEFKAQGFESLPMKGLGKLSVERMLSTARLIAEKDGVCRELARFSLGVAGRMDTLARQFNDHASGEKKESEALPEEELFCTKCGTRYPEPERKICPKCLNKFSLTGRLLSFFRYYKWKVLLILVLILLSAAFGVVSPFIGTKMLFDSVLTPGGLYFGMLLPMILLLVAIRLSGIGLSILYGRTVAGIMPWVVYDLKVRIFTAMQKLSMGFYTSKQTGSLMNRVNQDADNIYWFFVDGVPYTIVNVLSCLGVLGFMLYMDWQLALVVVATVPVIIVTFRFLWALFRKLHHVLWVRGANLSALVSDALNGQRVIKAFSKEEEESSRFGGLSLGVNQAEVKLFNAEFTAFPLIKLVTIVGEVLVLALGGIKVIQGHMTVGTLLAFIAYMGMLYGPLDFLSWVSNWWSRCIDSAQRVFEIMDSRPDVAESERPVRLENIRGDIEVTDAYFEYEAGRPVIRNASMRVKAGQMLGIVGKSGAGKSTIVNLMARLYDVKEGSIAVDGIPIKDIAVEDLRRSIGIVSQEMYLFMGTIADNIRYARTDAPMEDVIAAAKAASAHDFIIKLPDGYDTRIGSGAQDLSGGEKQRLSIARAIIQNPRILILDEATASMDTETERSIQNALGKLKAGRTTISIAHRLSTLRDADMLAVIDGGKVVEYGTHAELIQKKGEYYNLFRLQSEALKLIGVGD